MSLDQIPANKDVNVLTLPNEGQQTMANSISVAIASDQSTVPISGTVDTELTTADLDTGAGTDTRAVVGLVGSASGGGQLIPGSTTDGLLVNLGANNDVTVTGTVTANAGTNLNTSALALESGGNLSATATSLAIIDDWDETDRAKVNPIVGQAGIAGGSGTTSSATVRVITATDQPALAGASTIISVTPTISTSAYAADDQIGGLQTLTSAVRSSGGTAVLHSITILDKAKVNAGIDIYLFDSSPTVASSDNAAIDVSDAEMASKCIAMIKVPGASYSSLTNSSIVTIRNVGIVMKASGSTSLYALAKIVSASTYSSTSDLTFRYHFLQD